MSAQYFCMDFDLGAEQCGKPALATCHECLAFGGADVPLCSAHANHRNHVGHRVEVIPPVGPSALFEEFLAAARKFLDEVDPAELAALVDKLDRSVIGPLQEIGERMERRSTLAAAEVVVELEARGWSRADAIALTGARPAAGGSLTTLLDTLQQRLNTLT